MLLRRVRKRGAPLMKKVRMFCFASVTKKYATGKTTLILANKIDAERDKTSEVEGVDADKATETNSSVLRVSGEGKKVREDRKGNLKADESKGKEIASSPPGKELAGSESVSLVPDTRTLQILNNPVRLKFSPLFLLSSSSTPDWDRSQHLLSRRCVDLRNLLVCRKVETGRVGRPLLVRGGIYRSTLRCRKQRRL